MSEPQAVSSSQSYSIAQLRSLVKSGRLRVPQFQRSFRWEKQDVLNLVDSVLRGYPIGSLLLWKREAEAEHLRIGALDIEAGSILDACGWWMVSNASPASSTSWTQKVRTIRGSPWGIPWRSRRLSLCVIQGHHSSCLYPTCSIWDVHWRG